MSNTGLKLCPSCGGTNLKESLVNWKPAIKCECGMHMVVEWIEKDKLVEKWNTRKPIERIVEQLEHAKSMVPVNRVLDDIINDKPEELGQLMAYAKAIEIVQKGGAE